MSISNFYKVPIMKGLTCLNLLFQNGGGEWESNPPKTIRPCTGFEDQERHQAPVTSAAILTPKILYQLRCISGEINIYKLYSYL